MPNVLKALRAEIRQVARNESKRASQPLRDQVRGLRRSLTVIERRLQALGSGRAGAAAAALAVAGDGRRARFAPALMKEHRAKVGLSRKAYALLLGVSSLTIYFWETGRTKPRRAAVLAWQALRKRGVRALRAQAGASAAAPRKRATARSAGPTKVAKRPAEKRSAKKRTTARGTKAAATKSGRSAKKRAARRVRGTRRGVRAKAG